MKKLVALILTIAMLSLMAIPTFAAPVTLTYIAGGASGLGVSGNRVYCSDISTYKTNFEWNRAVWNAGQSIKEGVTVSISDIEWDENNDNGVTVVISSATNPWVQGKAPTGITVFVTKTGYACVIAGTANNTTHCYGSWWNSSFDGASGGFGDKVGAIAANSTSFDITVEPNADYTAYAVKVNETTVHTLSGAGIAEIANGTGFNYGFQIYKATGNTGASGNAKIAAATAGSLSYRVSDIAFAVAPHDCTGGTATCGTLATCEICGEPYGDFSDTHTGGTEVRYATDKYTGDTYCLGCNTKLFEGSIITSDTEITTEAADVYATITGAADGTLFSVNISWGTFNYVYSEAGRTWNPDTLSYESDGTAGWVENNDGTITVENRSNAAVEVSYSFTATEGYEVGGEFYVDNALVEDAQTLGTAEGSVGNGPTVVAVFKPTGTLAGTNASNAKIGSITVVVSEAK